MIKERILKVTENDIKYDLFPETKTHLVKDANDNTIDQLISTGITETKEGEFLTFENTVNAITQNIEIYGNTIQDPNTLEITSSGIDQGDGTYLITLHSTNINIIPKNIVLHYNKTVDGSGNVVSGEDRFITDMFSCPNGGIIYYAPKGYKALACYDHNKTYIATVYQGGEVPSNTAYLKFIGQPSLAHDANLMLSIDSSPFVSNSSTSSNVILPVSLDGFGGVNDRVYFDKEETAWCVDDYTEDLIIDGTQNFGRGTPNTKTTIYQKQYTNVFANNSKVSILSTEFKSIPNIQWATDEEAIFINSDGYIQIRLSNDKGNLNEYAKTHPIKVKYLLKEPKKIVLPLSTQILLNSFMDKTHCWVESGEAQATIKATASKSLASTVESNTEEIVKLNNNILNINGLKESQDLTYSTDKGYLVCKNTKNGSVKDLVVKGKTEVNLSTQRGYTYDFNVESTRIQRLASGLSGTEFTIVHNLIHDYTEFGARIFATGIGSTPAQYKVLNKKIGKNVTQLVFEHEVTAINIYVEMSDWNAKKAIAVQDIILLRGLRSEEEVKTLGYFEGMKSVGEDVDKIEVLTSNSNLFDESVLSSRLEADGYYHFRTEGNTRVSLFFGIVDDKTQQVGYMGVNNSTDLTDRNLKGYRVLIGINGDVKDDKLLFPIEQFPIRSFEIYRGAEYEIVSPNHIKVKNPYICKGNKPRAYISHKHDKKPLLYKDTTTNTWKPIPYLTEFDTIDTVNGKWYKGGFKEVFDGSSDENWIIRNTKTNTQVFGITPTYRGDTLSVCNRFKSFSNANTGWTSDTEEGVYVIDYIHLNRFKTNVSTVEALKQELQTKPIEIVYKLERQEIYDIVPLSLDAYEGETLVQCNSGAISPVMDFKITSTIISFVQELNKRLKALEKIIFKE